jgi:hypothetical protein
VKNAKEENQVNNMSQQKVTQEELDHLRKIQEENDRAVIDLGRISYQRAILDNQEQTIKQNIISLQQRESEFSNKLVEKYGDIKVDLETGTIS